LGWSFAIIVAALNLLAVSGKKTGKSDEKCASLLKAPRLMARESPIAIFINVPHLNLEDCFLEAILVQMHASFSRGSQKLNVVQS